MTLPLKIQKQKPRNAANVRGFLLSHRTRTTKGTCLDYNKYSWVAQMLEMIDKSKAIKTFAFSVIGAFVLYALLMSPVLVALINKL